MLKLPFVTTYVHVLQRIYVNTCDYSLFVQKCRLTLKIINISSKVPVQCISIVWFQKISVPTQKVLIEDFEGGGESQKPKFLGKV